MDHLVPASDLPVAAKQLLLSGRPLPTSLRDEGFDAVEKLLGRHYRGPVETPVPDEFASEAWWIARRL